MAPYAALIDLVGVRELAVDSAADYLTHASNFRSTLERIFAKRTSMRVFFFRDHCYIENDSRDQLCEALLKLRHELLLHDGLNIRGAVAAGTVGAKSIHFPQKEATQSQSSKAEPIIAGFGFGVLASKLFGLLESLKAIAVMIDPDLCATEPDVLAQTVETFYVSEGRVRRYNAFRDLKDKSAELTPSLLANLVNNFRHSRASSRKVARFYVAALLSWARTMDLSSREPTLDEEIVKGRLGRVRDVAGMELVYLALLDRVYSPKATEYDEARVEALKEFYLAASWLHSLIRSHDYNAAPIPASILSGSSRRGFITDLGRYEKRKRTAKTAEVGADTLIAQGGKVGNTV